MSKKLLVSLSTPIILLLVLLLGFQNCSKNGDTNFAQAEALSFDSDSPEIKNVVEGTDLVLELPKTLIDEKFPSIAYTCKWAYKGSDDQVLELDELDGSLRLDDVQIGETGRYRVVCTGGNIQVVIIFVVIINPYVPPADVKGVLKINVYDESTASNEEISDITRASAVVKCNEVAAENATKAIVCTWKDEVIYKRDLPAVKKAEYTFISHIDDVKQLKAVANVTENSAKGLCALDSAELLKKTPMAGYECFFDKISFKKKEQDYKKDIYRGYFIVDSKKEKFIETKDITRMDALANCKKNADANPKKSILCTWGTQKIFSRIVEEPKKDVYMGYFIEKGKTRLFITTKNIERGAALENCKLNHKNNPKYGILCTWGKETILKVAEPVVKKATYIGYFIEGGKERLFIMTKEISRDEALENCKLNNKNNPSKGIRCVWGEETILKVAEPKKLDTYVGYFIENSRERKFITTEKIDRDGALANCKLNLKNNPQFGIRCTWGKETILKVEEPPAKKTYIGYFIVKGKKSMFIKTEKIEKDEALKNCKLNATNNPKKSILCTWDGQKIYERIFDADK